ncbi:MAG: endonuclease/exonuclease/phosphatase family metal-dependent hydrolase [Arenicella sp.]|jgi:endonuclease/exonuclease/phosphatase family metal-dependent hydrolase
MNKKILIILLVGFFTFTSCQEEISPKPPVSTSGNSGGDGDNAGGSDDDGGGDDDGSGGDGDDNGGSTGGAEGSYGDYCNQDSLPAGTDASHTVSSTYQNCFSVMDENTFDVVTWNIENFPVAGATTINHVEDIIKNLYADVIAVQEIKSVSDFNTLLTKIRPYGYEGVIGNVHGSIELGYIYKKSEITAISSLDLLYTEDRDAFPRQPVLATFTHKSGKQFTLINIHLKARDEGKERRKKASAKLKSYIDTNLPNASVIILGDFNDEIKERFSGGDAFANFVDDADDFHFATSCVEEGSSANFSYPFHSNPNYLSQIDHILVTNELFSKLKTVETLRVDQCLSNYENQVSDHRPVMARFLVD